MDRCANCGKELTPEFCEILRKPCPECGSAARAFFREAQDGLCVSGTASWTQNRPGVQSTAQLTDQGEITLTATGPAPRNEEDALEICTRLVRVLNLMGGTWSAPVEGKQDIDGESMNADGGKLQMQVVRASNNAGLWKELNATGSASVDFNAISVASELMAAIRKKSDKYPAAQKKAMVLVLDAGRTPSHTFQDVFIAFRRERLEECMQAGFEQVWAVGPHDGLVERLDVRMA